MKKLLPFLLVLLTSCVKDEIEIPEEKVSGIKIVQNIHGTVTWTNDNIYIISGRISVEPGSTLIIEPGTIIKGESGTGANASSLLVSRNATIIAEGTPNLPIIFTSVADQITLEQVRNGIFESPNLRSDINGLWGGVIILGNAPISASSDVAQIEGIPTSDQNGLYGGSDPDDNSGILRYVSIRHGGTNIGSGNEINGLTLGGVGRGTVVDNIEIIANQDDGVEFFGGTVDATNIIVWNVGDDAIDTDQAWSGTLDNFMIISPQGHCFELDGPEGMMTAGHTIKNGLVRASGSGWSGLDLINTDDNSIVHLQNITFTQINAGQMINRTSYSEGEVIFDQIFLDIDPSELSSHIGEDFIPGGISAGNTLFFRETGFEWTWSLQ
jgi:hypothetical protein